jgi:hypothetical protein
VTFSTPWNDDGVVIETMSTLGKVVAVSGRLPMSSNPGVSVDTV